MTQEKKVQTAAVMDVTGVERSAQPADAACPDCGGSAAHDICAIPHRRSVWIQSSQAGPVVMRLFRRRKLHFDLRIGLQTSLAPSGGAAGEPTTALLRVPLPLKVAAFVAVAAFLALAGRLVQLQGLRGDDYLQKSTSNFIRERELAAVRGQIRDRSGAVLAGSPTLRR